MSLPRLPRQWVLGSTAVAVVVAAAALYNSVRGRANADYLTRRNYRVLAIAGRQIQELMRTAGNMASRTIDQACEQALGHRDKDDPCRMAIAAAERTSQKRRVHDRIQNALHEQFLERRNQPRREASLEFGEYTVSIGPRSRGRHCPLVSAGKMPGKDDTPWTLLRMQQYQGVDCTLSITTRAQGTFDSLFKPILTVFDSVTLLDDQRRVLRAIPKELPIDSLLGDRDRGLPRATGSVESEGGPLANAAASLPIPRLSVPPGVETVTVASRKYLAFCQRLGQENGSSLSGFTLADGGRPWMACGLVDVDRFETEAVALNPYWLIALGSFLALGMLSWPFLKVASLGPTERLRLADLTFLALSLVAGCALVTLLVLDATSYLAIDSAGAAPPERPDDAAQDLESQLRRLADDVHGNFERELEDMRAMLFALRDLPTEALVPYLDKESGVDKDLNRLLEKPLRYPFRNAHWVDRTGKQRVKWSREPSAPALFPVKDRAYFKNTIHGRLWPVDGEGKERFVLDAVQSRLTGELRAVLATSVPALERDQGPWVITLGAKPFSVISPLLPPGFGFAVIARDGRTLFHSGRDSMAEEDSFEEFDRNPRLMAAVFSRTEDVFDAKYWGRDHLVHVSPVSRLPLFLVVFADKNLLRTAHLELLSLCLAALVALLTGLTLYGVWARALVGRVDEHCLWPRSDAASRYVFLASLLLLFGLEVIRSASSCSPGDLRLIEAFALPLGAVGLVACVLAGPSRAGLPRVLALVGLPLGAVVATALTWGEGGAALGPGVLLLMSLALALGPERLGANWGRSARATHRAYVAWGLACLIATAVAPSFALFRIAWERQMRLLVRHGQLDLVRRLDEREAAPSEKDGPAGAPAPPPGTSAPGEGRSGYAFLYASHFYGTTIGSHEQTVGLPSDQSASSEHPWLDSLAGRLPLYNGVSVRLRGMAKACAKDREWSVVTPPTDPAGPGLRLLAQRSFGKGSYTVASQVPAFRVLGHAQPWFALAGMLAVAWGLLRFLARRFFLLSFREPETIALDELSRRPVAAHLFVVCPPLADKQAFHSQPELLWVDLGRGPLRAVDPRAIPETHPHVRAVCFDRFEQLAGDPAGREALLEALESLVDAANLPVMVLSELEPEAVLAPGEGGRVDDQARRWGRLLGHFARIVAADPGDPIGFTAALEAAEEQASARVPARADAAARRRRELFATLRRECSLHRQLQVVGITLAREPGFEQGEPERLVRHLRERAEGFYRALWACLTPREKLVLTQVASGHLVNPRCGRALSRLLARRLLVREVGFRLVNRSFGRFVLSEARPDEVAAWERSGSVSLWAQMRVPILISMVGVAGFLAYTQGDTLSSWLAAIGTAVPALVKLAELLRSAPTLAQAASSAGSGAQANA